METSISHLETTAKVQTIDYNGQIQVNIPQNLVFQTVIGAVMRTCKKSCKIIWIQKKVKGETFKES